MTCLGWYDNAGKFQEVHMLTYGGGLGSVGTFVSLLVPFGSSTELVEDIVAAVLVE